MERSCWVGPRTNRTSQVSNTGRKRWRTRVGRLSSGTFFRFVSFITKQPQKKLSFSSTGFFSNLSMFRRFVPRSGVMVKPICKALEISCIFKYVQHYSPHIMNRTLTAFKNGLKCPIISFKKATGAHRNQIGKRIKWTLKSKSHFCTKLPNVWLCCS